MGMVDENLVQTKLHNQTQADGSSKYVENSRYLYHLEFSEPIGWDWLQAQVQKASAKVSVDLELWKLSPSSAKRFAVIVREVDRRKNIDANQGDLFDYE